VTQPFVDTHCHLLAALDDGPPSLTASVRMARSLVAGGVGRVVCTPHFSQTYPVTVRAARASLQSLEEALAALDISLSLELAAEISPAFALQAAPDDLLERRLGRDHLLVELEPMTTLPEVDRILERLAAIEVRPVLAHPERCRALHRSPEILEQWRAEGAVLQVVAPSLTGAVDAASSHLAWELVGSGLAEVVGTDGHRAGGARVRLHELADVIATRCGGDRAEELLVRAPAALLAG
jgi:protein-tyrosine phosphatase